MSARWAGIAERGSALGIRLMAASLRLLGARAARLLLYPVVAYFLVTSPAARRASDEYFTRLRQFAGPQAALPAPGWGSRFRHMLAFAESALHKLAAWSGRSDLARVRFPARAELGAALAGGRGALLIGAHLGNLEMSRALAAVDGKVTVNAVVYAEHGLRFFGALARSSPDFGVNLIHVAEVTPAVGIALKEKVDRGELLVIVGDRTPAGEDGRVCEVEFLGAPAAFAQVVAIKPIREVAERNTGCGIGPARLTTKARVTKRLRRIRPAKTPHVALAIIASNDDPQGAIDQIPLEWVGHLPRANAARFA